VTEEKLPKRFEILDDDGLARPGERVDPDDVYVNKQSPKDTVTNTVNINPAQVEYRNTPMTYKTKVAGYIDKVRDCTQQRKSITEVVEQVMITDTDHDQALVKVLIRQTRVPELGDKFSSRHGQKGTPVTFH
jgi:DNA-directed RNA polymerase III subunit RPC2